MCLHSLDHITETEGSERDDDHDPTSAGAPGGSNAPRKLKDHKQEKDGKPGDTKKSTPSSDSQQNEPISQQPLSHNSFSIFHRVKPYGEKKEVKIGKLYDNYKSEFPKPTTQSVRIPEEKPTQGMPKITRSQYKELTGLDTVVSSNFGIVVPDESESDSEEGYRPKK